MNTDNSHKQTEFHKNFTVILNKQYLHQKLYQNTLILSKFF